MAGEKLILLGNRGIGKSAIFQMIAHKEKVASNVVLQMSPEDYSYQMLTDIISVDGEGQVWGNTGAFAAAWKYLILIQVMKELRKVMGGGNGKATVEERRLRSFLRDNFIDSSNSPLDMLIGYIKRMQGVQIGPYEASIKVRELTKLYKLEEIEPHLEVMKKLARRTRVSVLVDELDTGWDNSETSKSFVAGLFQACNAINRMAPGHLRVYVSLRQELYNGIPALYDDAQKYRDLFEFIKWDPESLRKLLISRIQHFVPALRQASPDEAWRTVFPDSRSFRFMIDRSQHRPRELITYATAALNFARSRGITSSIPIDALIATEVEYSRERSNDVVREFKSDHPGLDSVFACFREKSPIWPRGVLEELCLELALGARPVSREAFTWVDGRDPDRLLDVLWQVGFLKAEAKRAPHESARFVASYEDPYVNLVESSRFAVHPMFHAYLGLGSPSLSR